MRPSVKAKLVYSTVTKKALILTTLSKYQRGKRPRIKAGDYIRVFGKLADISSMPAFLKN
nr:MAG TPA: hypothetical protein [Crassvirales sp.]